MTKVCSRCGETKDVGEFYKHAHRKDGVGGWCKLCSKVYSKKYNQDNKEKVAARQKKYRKNNKEKLIAWHREYRKTPIRKAQKRKYRQEHKEKIAEYTQEHKEEKAAWAKEYYQTPEGRAVERKRRHNRRARKNNAEYEAFDPTEIFERDGWRCQCCKKKVRPDFGQHHPLYPNLDHIVCLANGGSHTRKNTQLLCHRCNMVKGTNDIGEQMRLFG